MTAARGAQVPPTRAGSRTSLLLALLLLGGCGVDPQRAPEPVPRDRLPSVEASASLTDGVLRGRVWVAREQRLVPVSVELDGIGVQARVRAVLALADDRLPTVLPPGCRLVAARQQGDMVELTLCDDLERLQRRDLPLALGQLVLSVTEEPSARRVLVRTARRTVPLVDTTGRTLTRPLTRGDFAGLVQNNTR